MMWALVAALWVALAFWAGRASVARAPDLGLPIKLRHQIEVARFSVGQVVEVDEALLLTSLGAPFSTGTIEERLVVTALDWDGGSIWVRAAR